MTRVKTPRIRSRPAPAGRSPFATLAPTRLPTPDVRPGEGAAVGWSFLYFIGSGIVAALPALAVVLTFGVIRRAGEFALSEPAREVLFRVVPRDKKYKAKNFLDTVVYRGGDALSSRAAAGLRALGGGFRTSRSSRCRFRSRGSPWRYGWGGGRRRHDGTAVRTDTCARHGRCCVKRQDEARHGTRSAASAPCQGAHT